MSIICGYKRGDSIYIATDSQLNYGNCECGANIGDADVPKQGKFLPLKRDDILVAAAGAERPSQIVAEVFDRYGSKIETKRDLRNIVKRLVPAMAKESIGKMESDGLTEYDIEIMVGTKKGLYIIESELSITDNRDFQAVGCAWIAARAAYMAIDKDCYLPEVLLRRVTRIACRLNSYCGGRIHIRRIDY